VINSKQQNQPNVRGLQGRVTQLITT